jgi:hypothetical protein
MSIPDAFSLNSRSHRRRSITRSPPPSSLSLLAHHAHATTTATATQPNEPINFIKEDTEPLDTSMSLRNSKQNQHQSNGNGVANGDAKVLRSRHVNGVVDGAEGKPARPQTIDWEVPRKVFHSSIGVFRFLWGLNGFSTFFFFPKVSSSSLCIPTTFELQR